MMNSMENNIRIHKMFCIPTEHSYQTMYKRNFSLGVSQNNVDMLESYFINQGVQNNAELSMTSAATNLAGIVKLSSKPDGVVDIPNGWDTQRLMFVLVVDEEVSTTLMLTHYIQGYSEYYDPSHIGTLDPNAVYYINSVTTVTRTRNSATNAISSRVTSTYNVVSDPTGNMSYQSVTDPSVMLEMIRPSDIITNIYANELYGNSNAALNVKTSSITNSGNVSSKANNDPLKYFTNTVNSVIKGKCIDVGGNNYESILTNANGLVAEQAITNNSFMRSLAGVTGVLEPWCFTLNHLTTIDPTTSSKVTVVDNSQIVRDPTTTTMLDTNNTESMLNYTAETDVVQTFVNTITTAMSENLITVASGIVTNVTGTPVVTISNIQSFLEGVDITPYGNSLINYISSVIMPQLSLNNLRIIDIAFECDLLGDSTVSVCVDSQPQVIFRLPTFADSLYSPVVATPTAKEAVIDDFEGIVDTVLGLQPQNVTGVYNGY